jgi:hypothetical protein
VLQDANDQPPQRAARMRHLLAAVAVAAALCASVALADISQHQPSPGREDGSHQGAATVVSLTSFSVPVSLTVSVPPVTVLNRVTRSQAISRVIGRLNQLLAARHLNRRKVGLVQVFASGPIAEIPRSQRAAHYVLDGLLRRDLTFARAAGQSYWTGSGNSFVFHVYFLS